jgi:hypothetical protein
MALLNCAFWLLFRRIFYIVTAMAGFHTAWTHSARRDPGLIKAITRGRVRCSWLASPLQFLCTSSLSIDGRGTAGSVAKPNFLQAETVAAITRRCSECVLMPPLRSLLKASHTETDGQLRGMPCHQIFAGRAADGDVSP